MRIRTILTVAACLVVTSCIFPPAYWSTEYVCAKTRRAFSDQPALPGEGGLTDMTTMVLDETALRMLAENRIDFIEQSLASQGPLSFFTRRKSKGVVRLSLVDGTPASCLANVPEMNSGRLYRLYLQGMPLDRCVQVSEAASPSGRFVLARTHEKPMGAHVDRYALVDTATHHQVDEVVWANSQRVTDNLLANLLDLFIPQASMHCRADVQSIGRKFVAVPRANGTPPLPPPVTVAKVPYSGDLPFVRSELSWGEFNRLLSSPPEGGVVVVNGFEEGRRKALLFENGALAAHLDVSQWQGCSSALMGAESGAVLVHMEASGLHLLRVRADGRGTTAHRAVFMETGRSLSGGCGSMQAFVRGDKLVLSAERIDGGKSAIVEADLRLLP